MKKGWFAFLFVLAGLLQAQETELFEEATQFYAGEQYEEAIQRYEQILGQNKTSAALYYNLGNAYYRMDSLAPSIYYYYKALELAPNDSDILTNLSFAEEQTRDLIEEPPKTGWNKFFEQIIPKQNYNQWAFWAILFSFLAALLGILYYFSKKSVRKRIFFGGSILSGILMIASLTFAFTQFNQQKNTRAAVVFNKEIAVHAEPNHNSEEVFYLHEGTKVKVLDNFNGYARIQLNDGKRGWLKESAVKEL